MQNQTQSYVPVQQPNQSQQHINNMQQYNQQYNQQYIIINKQDYFQLHLNIQHLFQQVSILQNEIEIIKKTQQQPTIAYLYPVQKHN